MGKPSEQRLGLTSATGMLAVLTNRLFRRVNELTQRGAQLLPTRSPGSGSAAITRFVEPGCGGRGGAGPDQTTSKDLS